MAASVSELTKSWLFRARMETGNASNAAKIQWLYERYKCIESGGTEEVTGTSFGGQSSSFQHRGATPEDNMAAIQAAIEHLESLDAGAAGSEHGKPFGFRFGIAPADAIDRANLT
jgi:hypothetical protein